MVDAKVHLARCYQNGIGTARRKDEAVRLFVEAAKAGNAQGMLMLGYCYAHGEGTARNEKQAVRMYKAAADRGLPQAQVNLALLLQVCTVIASAVFCVLFWRLCQSAERSYV